MHSVPGVALDALGLGGIWGELLWAMGGAPEPEAEPEHALAAVGACECGVAAREILVTWGAGLFWV
ncbi:hypothetical protein DV096_13370 [Bradymonadaceae bacterium TMQ3]|nr:hypothetical protein DV096_13370 [Bradymonadaceae bacterium TMQ3]